MTLEVREAVYKHGVGFGNYFLSLIVVHPHSRALIMIHLELPIASFISAFLVLVPLPWHWRTGNVATLSLITWLFVVNVMNGFNTIVWADNAHPRFLVWCDISTKIQKGSVVAIPAAMFCLCMQLERLSSGRLTQTTHAAKRRRQIIEALLCFGIPVLYMALHIIVQNRRFDVVQFFGCRPSLFPSVPSIFATWLPPLFFSVGAIIFAGLAFSHFWSRRMTFAKHLQSSSSALSSSRYFRLMCMALAEIAINITMLAVNMSFTVQQGLQPWISWAHSHKNFTEIGVFPASSISHAVLVNVSLIWWTIPFASLVFFAFFAFGQEAVKDYQACVNWMRGRIFRMPNHKQSSDSTASLPSYASHIPLNKTSPGFASVSSIPKVTWTVLPTTTVPVYDIVQQSSPGSSPHSDRTFSPTPTYYDTSAPSTPRGFFEVKVNNSS